MNIYENIKNVIHEWGYMYKMNNISAAFSHRLLKFVLNESYDIDLLFCGQKCKLSYLHILRIHEY